MAVTDTIENLYPLFNDLGRLLYVLDNSQANHWLSWVSSLPQAYLHQSTPSDLSILDNTKSFAAPDAAYQVEHSPSIAQFLSAASSERLLLDSTPEGTRPFEVDGKQLEIVDQVAGLSARVWETDENQVVIAYSGTLGGETRYVNPLQIVGQVLADATSLSTAATPTKSNALAFAEYVVSEADKQGIDADDVFVTGSSLGAFEAEYVAWQTGLGGVGFEGFGLPEPIGAVGEGENFVSVINYGDIVASLSSDVEGAQPLAPDFDPQGGAYPHYGALVFIGDPQHQVELHEHIAGELDAAPQAEGLRELTEVVVLLQELAGSEYHNLTRITPNLGVQLAHLPVTDPLPETSSPAAHVFDAADYNLAQTLAANEYRSDYHAAALPPV